MLLKQRKKKQNNKSHNIHFNSKTSKILKEKIERTYCIGKGKPYTCNTKKPNKSLKLPSLKT